MSILLRFLAVASTAAGLTSASLAVLAQATDVVCPNIILFVGDDLGWRDTGPYGNHFIRTPDIDRLAQSGLLVRSAFGTTPHCSPSRTSTLTGEYAHAVGAEDLHTTRIPLLRNTYPRRGNVGASRG